MAIDPEILKSLNGNSTDASWHGPSFPCTVVVIGELGPDNAVKKPGHQLVGKKIKFSFCLQDMDDVEDYTVLDITMLGEHAWLRLSSDEPGSPGVVWVNANDVKTMREF